MAGIYPNKTIEWTDAAQKAFDYTQLAGKYAVSTTKKTPKNVQKTSGIGSLIGGVGGAVAGSSIGSVIPGVGTVIGGMIGSALGGVAGSTVGEYAEAAITNTHPFTGKIYTPDTQGGGPSTVPKTVKEVNKDTSDSIGKSAGIMLNPLNNQWQNDNPVQNDDVYNVFGKTAFGMYSPYKDRIG